MITAALVLAGAAPSLADIINATGDAVVVAPPGSVAVGGRQSDTEWIAFREQAGFVLPAGVLVDLSAPGTAEVGDYSPSPATIPAGTLVDSFYLHSDPVNPPEDYLGTMTFDRDILGVIVLSAQLDATTGLLGALGTLYPLGGTHGLEADPPVFDSIALSADRRTLTVAFHTFGDVDQVRVLTAAAVPEPSSLALLSIGAVALIGSRRRVAGAKPKARSE